MTVSLQQLLFYALGMAGLWAVPGPVWVALTARAVGRVAAAWPLAVGVALGDLIWPLAAILGLSWIHEQLWRRPVHPALGRGGDLPRHGRHLIRKPAPRPAPTAG
jgi:hypothetical protein